MAPDHSARHQRSINAAGQNSFTQVQARRSGLKMMSPISAIVPTFKFLSSLPGFVEEMFVSVNGNGIVWLERIRLQIATYTFGVVARGR